MRRSRCQPHTISIHAPPRGATLAGTGGSPKRIFQFTPLREGRPGLSITGSTETEISIHAPPRGATCPSPGASGWESYFNSRPSARGDDLIVCDDVVNLNISIHAPPRGATPTSPWARRRWTFQFTPLREGRLKFTDGTLSIGKFQFTPLREGRRADGEEVLYAYANISIHAPPRGATHPRR